MSETDIKAVQDEIIEDFSLFDDWMDRYRFLIDLGEIHQEHQKDDQLERHVDHGGHIRVPRHFRLFSADDFHGG